MELQEAIKNRYSERDYGEKIPSDDLINQILQSAWHAPNSCNMQVMRFLVISDNEIREKMAKIATTKFLWAPINILMMVDSRVTNKRHSSIMSLGSAMQNMLLTATDLGLATCPMAGFSNDVEIKKFFGIPDYYDLVLVLGIGYSNRPVQQVKLRERIPLEESVDWNSYRPEAGLKNLSVSANEWTVSELIDYRRRISPVYRYENRFSLGTYSPSLSEDLVKVIKTNVNFNVNLEVLDINTYDGVFVKELIKNTQVNIKITISDYLDSVLRLTNDFGRGVEAVKIDVNNKLSTNKQFDIVTLIHKLQFNPDRRALLMESIRLTKAGGILFVAIDTQSNLTWFFKRVFINVKTFLKKEGFNVYENNPYYKIGPYLPYSKRALLKDIKGHGLSLVAGDIVCSGNKKASNQTYYAIFKKQ